MRKKINSAIQPRILTEKLFVGGIGWESNEDSVKEYFDKFGTVAYVKLKRNREDPSKHRGFAFVKFANPSDADTVLSHKEPHTCSAPPTK